MTLIIIGYLLFLVPALFIIYSIWFIVLQIQIKSLLQKDLNLENIILTILWVMLGLSVPVVLLGKFLQ